MTERGKFIILEGPGGSGKSTQLPKAVDYLKKNGINAIETREPGGIAQAELIRKKIFELKGLGLINADQQFGLFCSARAIWVNEVVEPNLAKGKSVISDRSFPASCAYQGYAEGGDRENILNVSKVIMGNAWPNAIIYYDISPETSNKRSIKGEDPFDDEKLSWTIKLVRGYREMWMTNWGGINWYTVDGENSIPKVSRQTQKVLDEIFSIK